MLKKGVVLSCVLVFLTAGIASAYRPLTTEDAGVAGKGVAQAELSWDNIKWKNSDKEEIFLLVSIYGLTENLELSVEIPYLYHKPASRPSEEGTGDIKIVAKYLLVPGGTESPAFAVKGVVKMDNGDYGRGLGSGDKDYSIVAALSETVGQLTGHAQIGYTWIGKNKDNNLREITFYGAALDYAASDDLHLLCEFSQSHNQDSAASEDPRSALSGLTYKVSDSLVVDAAYRWGLNDSAPYTGTTVGVSVTF
ncbi:MAG: transporter [Deltaproteobacteria bacterium]|nr:transporter [Deltaproteobacteria bacterium]